MATRTPQDDVLGLMGGLPALTAVEGESVTPGLVTPPKGKPLAPPKAAKPTDRIRQAQSAPAFTPLPLTPEAAPSARPPAPPRTQKPGLSLDFMPAAEAATLRPPQPTELPQLTKIRSEAQAVWNLYEDPQERATMRDGFESIYSKVKTADDLVTAGREYSRYLAAMAQDLKSQGADDTEVKTLLQAPQKSPIVHLLCRLPRWTSSVRQTTSC